MNLPKHSKHNSANQLTRVLFVVYLMVLFWIVLFKLGVQFSYMAERKVNFIPFRELYIFKGHMDLTELILNVIIFIPLGIYTGILYKKSGPPPNPLPIPIAIGRGNGFYSKTFYGGFGKPILLFFIISFLIEGLQYSLGIGAFDSTDLITNTVGGIFGLLIYKGIAKGFNHPLKAQKFINLIAALGTILMVLFLVLLKTNNLWIRYQ